MIRNKNQEWWHAEDLMEKNDIFVGYKAQARISELAIDYPEMIDRMMSNKGNRQHMYRFKFDNARYYNLPKYLDEFVKEELLQISDKLF